MARIRFRSYGLGTNCGTVSCMALQEIVSQLYILHAGILLSVLLGFANLKVLKPIQIKKKLFQKHA